MHTAGDPLIKPQSRAKIFLPLSGLSSLKFQNQTQKNSTKEFRLGLHGSNPEPLMSALGQKQTLGKVRLMSALPPKADIETQPRDVRFVPKGDMSLFAMRPASQMI